MTPLTARADAWEMSCEVGRKVLYPGCFQGETAGDGRNTFKRHNYGLFRPFLLKLPPNKSFAGREIKQHAQAHR